MIYIYRNRKWIPSEVKDLRKGDFFKKEPNEEWFWVAAEDAHQTAFKKWTCRTEKL